MGLFSKGAKEKKQSVVGLDLAPPVFNKHADEHLLKGYNPGRRASLPASAPALGAIKKPTPNSNSKFTIPPFAGGKTKKAGSNTSGDGSYIEELLEELSYDEEIIEEEYYEEEIVEVVEDLTERDTTIRFDEFEEMLTVLNIDDYSTHEIDKCWYNRADYDKMVQTARKTMEKVEAKHKPGAKPSGKSAPDTRGLEAWTLQGATSVRVVKEKALEAVWDEQSRQWSVGETNAEKIREAYLSETKAALEAAVERAEADRQAVEVMRREDQEEKGKRRKMLGKSKEMLGRSVRMTTGGVVKTGKLMRKTTKLTGKVALKAAVATATLDRRMLKEALTMELAKRKKREPEWQSIRRPSQMGHPRPLLDIADIPSIDSGSIDELSVASEATDRKKQKLKLLGIVPIPGTQRLYKDDLELKKIENRKNKMSRRPSWESGLSAGKY